MSNPTDPSPAYPSSTPHITTRASSTFTSAVHDAPNTFVQRDRIAPRSGGSWRLKAGQVCRIITSEGPQVGDLNLWSATNPRERFWAARTRQLHSTHVSVRDRLWSCLPYLRPMATITGDSLAWYGVDERGGRVHDLLGTRCDPYVNKLFSDTDFNQHCHSNLFRAIRGHGLDESDIHDVLNVFQVTGLNKDGKYWMGTSPAKQGDYFEFFAEIDLLCALSTCPGGDLSKFGWGASEAEMKETCRGLTVEVWDIKDKSVLKDWQPPQPVDHRGAHSLRPPI